MPTRRAGRLEPRLDRHDDRERFPGVRERRWDLDRPSARRELFIDKPRRPRAVEAGEPVHGHAHGCRSTKLDVDVTVLCTHGDQLPLRLGSAIECLFELCNQQGRDGGKAVDVDDVRVGLSKYVPHRGAVRFAHRAAERHGRVRTEPVAGGTADLLRQVRLDADLTQRPLQSGQHGCPVADEQDTICLRLITRVVHRKSFAAEVHEPR